jgi:DNA polymerase-3 subunit chi
MTEIRFYHLQQDTTTKAVPEILGKAVEKGLKILLKLPDEARCQFYDDWLWRYQADSFIPHGAIGDRFGEAQMVWLDTKHDPPNEATMAMVVEEADMPPLDKFDMVCLVFDSENQHRLDRARDLWAEYKKQPDLALTYWKQQNNGSWKRQDI